ncbi:MAG TPA: thioredoxin-like domain-containing protein [Pyrinomonadaceae bacterium]|nr:thioredoxin-like domain-containing protein [Pyrinomonadaceae bacterium]
MSKPIADRPTYLFDMLLSRKLTRLLTTIVLAGLVVTGVVIYSTKSSGSVKGFVMSQQERVRIRAPELSGGRGWLNTDRPLSLAALKGKVVLLDFWTYGCINCMHIIPDLKRLEAKYPNELVVIGVHSAKFKNEKETENIRRIILRYELEHPVYNDSEFSVWQSYGVRAWPTQVLIDPAGYAIGAVSGEGNYEVIDEAIAKTVAEFRKKGELNEEPLKLVLERAKVGDLPLAFPGKVLADERNDRLFIADSNHNRIVITKLDGTLVETIGTGERAAVDGPFEKATFYRPQGMALDGDTLYIADTENHLIRKVNLKARTVETIAGTGRQSTEYFKEGPGRSVGLNSPWDLQLAGRTLYIAMAGPHQIWKLDLDMDQISTFAGSGREARIDGALLKSGFAQPSGITTDGKSLYVADSESNIIRQIDLAKGQVDTLVGGDLFEFGDVDATGDEVRLQHPLGVISVGDKVLIADTYNHKIKELDPQKKKVTTLFGTGKPGQADGTSASFYEPGGLSVANGKLYVADTNNHAIRVIDLKTRETTTLRVNGLMPPQAADVSSNNSAPNAEEQKVLAQKVRARSEATLILNVDLPAGHHLNPAAPQRYSVTVDNAKAIAVAEKNAQRSDKKLTLPIRVPIQALETGAAKVRAQATLIYCRDDNTGTCRIKTLVWNVPVEVVNDAAAATELKLNAKLSLD